MRIAKVLILPVFGGGGQPLKYKAFTLAEVLITLGIIGIIAALTLPSLIQKQQEKARITQLKKGYSILQNTFNLAINDNGTPDNWGLPAVGTPEASKAMLDKMIPYLRIIKNCGNDSTGCLNDKNFLTLHGTNPAFDFLADYSAKAVLADGTSILFYVTNSDCLNNEGTTKELKNGCGVIYYNMEKISKQNQLGVTSFRFIVSKYGIFPTGTEAGKEDMSFAKRCQRNGADVYNGYGCTAWVLQHENMDYLHCDDLSWTGKTKCK